jgi:hypothetical protein
VFPVVVPLLAAKRFDKAMEKEESLRTIIPGVRILVPPSNGNNAKEEERVAAARQFLNKGVAILVPVSKKKEMAVYQWRALGVLTLLAASSAETSLLLSST